MGMVPSHCFATNNLMFREVWWDVAIQGPAFDRLLCDTATVLTGHRYITYILERFIN